MACKPYQSDATFWKRCKNDSKMAASVGINSVKEAVELVKSHEISTDSKFIVIKKDKYFGKEKISEIGVRIVTYTQ